MGFIDSVRGRQESIAKHVVQPEMANAGVKADGAHDGGENGYTSNSNSSQLSLEQRNEKDVIENANEVTSDAQLGIQKAEAAALVWSKRSIYLTYAWIWLCFFMLALQQSILNNVTYLAYSDFSNAPQLSTAYILSSVVGGVLRLPIAKVLNLWGRAEGFFVFIVVYIVGMIIIAACKGPNSYAAGYTIYWIGYDALYFIMDVFIADTSGLKNRAFAMAFASTPFICTAFTGPLAAESFLGMASWRWAVGAFCIIQVFVFTPLCIVFKFYQHKAEKQGLFIRTPSGRTTVQSIIHYFKEFDIIGGILLIAAFVIFLLPFSMTSYSVANYKSGTFIAMVVVGFLLFPAFALWERFGATTHFVRWELFKKRTVLGACMMAAVAYYSFYAWDLYYYYFVMIVYDLNISMTGYMTQIYNVGSCFWGVVFGIYIRWSKHFKYACLCFALPLLTLGSGLMIYFRGNDASIGYIVMCQIFIAFGGGQMVIGDQMAVMAAADRDGVPMMLALLGLCNNLGGAIGQAVAAAIYQNTFTKALTSHLPANSGTTAADLSLGGYTLQMTYPQGTPIREAVNYAWGYSQKWNCVSSTAMMILGFVGVGLWKNYNVDRKQNKGNVL